MRIGMVGWSFFPRTGGSVTTIMQLSEELVSRGIKVDIIAPLLKKDIPAVARLNLDNRIRIRWVVSSLARGYADFFSRAVFFVKIVAAVRKASSDIDVFHCHEFNVSFLSAILGTKKPIVAVFGADPLFELRYFHARKSQPYEDFLTTRWVPWAQKIYAIFLKAVSLNKPVVVSLHESVTPIIKKYYSGKVVLIPAGLAIQKYAQEESVRREKSILVVARSVPWKRIDKAIEIFKQVQKHDPQVRMTYVGSGPLFDNYRQRYKEVRGLNFVSGADYHAVSRHLAGAGVLLNPTEYETFSIVISEAMASGLPIVASALPVFSGRLRDNETASLAGRGTVEDFSRKVIELMNDGEKRARMAQKAREIIGPYSIDAVAQKYIDLYKTLLSHI